MDINNFETDIDKELNGVWVDLDDTTRIKVARMNNKNYAKTLKKLMAPHKMSVRRNTLDDEVAEKILTKAMAKNILIDWEGLTENNEEVEYSYDKSLEILLNPSFKDFRDLVSDTSMEMELFKNEDDEEAIKN